MAAATPSTRRLDASAVPAAPVSRQAPRRAVVGVAIRQPCQRHFELIHIKSVGPRTAVDIAHDPVAPQDCRQSRPRDRGPGAHRSSPSIDQRLAERSRTSPLRSGASPPHTLEWNWMLNAAQRRAPRATVKSTAFRRATANTDNPNPPQRRWVLTLHSARPERTIRRGSVVSRRQQRRRCCRFRQCVAGHRFLPFEATQSRPQIQDRP